MKKILCGILAMLSTSMVMADSNMAVNKNVNVSFVQVADKAMLTKTNANQYRLVLVNVKPHLAYFSDRPNRVVGQIHNASYLAKWNMGKDSLNKDAPNAILTGENINGKEVHLYVDLAQPKLSKRDFSYEVTMLSKKKHADSIVIFHPIMFIDEVCLSCIG